MKNKRMVKLLALAMSMTLVLQPIAVFAEEGEPIAEPAVVEMAPQVNDAVEEKVEAAETAVEKALPDNEVAQPTTDKYLESTDEALENIDGRIEALDNLNDAAKEKKEEYKEAVGEAEQSVLDAAEKSGEAAGEGFTDMFVTGYDAYVAGQKADEVEQKSDAEYETQEEAETAKAEATVIAGEAQQAADHAAQVVEELGEKLEEAETAMLQAKDDLDAAEDALDEANRAVRAAENALRKIQEDYGLNRWYYPESDLAIFHGSGDAANAINNAQAALAEAKRLQRLAEQEVTNKQNEYNEADQAYKDADQAVKDAQDQIGQAQADLEAANTLKDIINKVDGIEKNEMDTWNEHKEGYGYNPSATGKILRADKDLAKALIEFKLYGKENLKIHSNNGQGHGNSQYIMVTYKENGRTVTEYYDYEIENVVYTIDDHDSVHWLQINKYNETKHRFEKFYLEYTYYTVDRHAVSNAQAVVDGLNDIINNTDLDELDRIRSEKEAAIGTAEDAKKDADNKLSAVGIAYEKVIAAAKALKQLKATGRASSAAVDALTGIYNASVVSYNAAVVEYAISAELAGIAQEEADRALAALQSGFDYRIPTPAPNPGPTPGPSGEPTGDTTPSDTTDYIPVAPIAVTPAPAAPAPQQAVLGATRTRSGAAATAVEAGEGEEEKKAAPAVEKKQEEKKEETKPAVAIEEEETAKAAAPIATQTPFPWWVLIILAAITALSIEEYVRRRNAKVNAQG